jgi:TMEM175 potassium channel family protein
MGTNRMESFSDGVIAVAITLLALGLSVPDPRHTADLADALSDNWPGYAAYVTSFITIGIIWINHHAMISRLRQVDQSIMILNLLLLMSIGILPFATDLIAGYLTRPRGQSTAAAVYGGSFLLMGLMFAALNRQVLLRRPHLLRHPLPAQERRLILGRSLRGVPPYALATGLAFVSPYITLVICGALAAYYALPVASGTDQSA